MNKTKTAKWSVGSIAIVLILAIAMSACQTSETPSPTDAATDTATDAGTETGAEERTNDTANADLPLLAYNVFTATQTVPAWVNEADDVMAQYIANRFKIQVGEVSYLQGMTFKERMNLYIASDQLPDVVQVFGDNVTIPATGRYAELGDLIKQHMPNFLEYVPEEYWNSMLYNKKMYNIGSVALDGADYPDDPWADPMGTWNAIWTTESTLSKAGYTFTPLPDILRKANEEGRKLTYADFKIEPEIKTPEDFYQFLKKIKDGTPAAGGQEVIPFSIPIWLEPHLGYMFGLTGWWKYDPDTKQVNGFLSDPKAKEYWQFMNKLYAEGLLDQNFAVQKTEQMNEKILQLRIKSFMWSANNADVQKAVREADPNDNLRAVPLPVAPDAKPLGIDHVGKISHNIYIRKDFPDIPRLLAYFDWALSQEAQELYQWGSEELGLWEIRDGNKMWKDEALFNALMQSDSEYLKTNYWGKGLGGGNEAIASKAFNFRVVPMFYAYNPFTWRRSYSRTYDENDFNIQSAYVSAGGWDSQGYLSPGGDEASNRVTDFVYGEFEQVFSPKLFAAKDSAEFDRNWDELLQYWNEKINYPEAKKNMELIFKMRGFDVVSQ